MFSFSRLALVMGSGPSKGPVSSASLRPPDNAVDSAVLSSVVPKSISVVAEEGQEVWEDCGRLSLHQPEDRDKRGYRKKGGLVRRLVDCFVGGRGGPYII